MNFISSLYFSNVVIIAICMGGFSSFIYICMILGGDKPRPYNKYGFDNGYMMRGIPLLNMQTPLTCQQKFLQDLSSKLLS